MSSNINKYYNISKNKLNKNSLKSSLKLKIKEVNQMVNSRTF